MADDSNFFFGLTIGELGFILFFIMVILAFFEVSARDEKIQEVMTRLEDAERTLQAQAELAMQLEEIVGTDHSQNLNDIIVRLEKAILIKQENEILREHVSRLTEKIEESEAFEKLLSSYINMEETGLAEIVQTIGDIEATKEFLEQAAIDAPSDSLLEQVKSIVQQAEDAQRRVAQVISQGRGIDYPPCWLDEENKAELTFTITVFASADVNIKKRDLPHREQQYSRLPSYPDIITSTINREMFERLALPILEESKTKDCRYYAQVRFDSVEACRFQFVIDKYFYPYVAPSDRHTCTG